MNALMTPRPTSSIAMFRRWLLRIHGTILTLVALGSAVATTIGWMTGIGLFGAEPHGLGRADPGVSADDDYCGITGNWLG